MATKTKSSKAKPIVINNPPPSKKKSSTEASTGLPKDVQFLGESLVKEADRINKLEKWMKELRADIKRVMGRMCL